MRTKLILTALCAVATCCVCLGGEVRYVLTDTGVVAQGAPPVASAPKTRVVMVKECTTDQFGNVTCRMVPRTEVIPEPVVNAAWATTSGNAPIVNPDSASCPCVAATGSCPCAGTMSSAPVAVTASYAFPRLHAARMAPMPHPVRSFIQAVFARFHR